MNVSGCHIWSDQVTVKLCMHELVHKALTCYSSFITVWAAVLAVLAVIILSVCLSVRHMHSLWQNQTMHCRYFDTTRKDNHSSFLTPTTIGAWRLLPSEICTQSHPPFEKCRVRYISAYNVSTVRNSEKSSIMTNGKSTTGFQMSYGWSAYVTHKSPKGWLKKQFFVFWIKFYFN